MATTISKLNVILSGNMSELSSALNAGKEQVLSFESSVSSAATSVTGILAGIGIGLSIGAVTDYIKSTFEAVDANAKLSDSLGISTESLAHLQYAANIAGVGTDQLQTGLVKMLKGLSDAENGTGKAGAALQRLGLDAKTLINESPDVAFAKIGDALKTVENPAERAGATMDIFGKSGAELLPILTEGSAKLGAMGIEADKLGLSLSRVDAAQIEAANESIKKVEQALQGATNQLAVKLAPFLEAMANKLVELSTHGEGLAGIFINAFEAVVTGVAKAADYLDLLKAGFRILQAGGAEAIAALIGDIAHLADGFAYLYEKVTGKKLDTGFLHELSDGLHKDAEDFAKKAGEAFDNFQNSTNSKAASRFFDDLRASSRAAAQAVADDKTRIGGALAEMGDESEKSAEKISKKLAEMQAKVDAFSKSKGEIAASEIAGLGGDFGDQVKASQLADQLEGLEKLKKAHEEAEKAAKKLYDETRTPAEKYTEQLDKINELEKAGAIDSDTAARARLKALDDENKALHKEDGKESKGAEGAAVGSAEAIKLVAENQRALFGGGDTPKQQLSESKQQTKLLSQLVNKKAPTHETQVARI